MNDYVVSHHVYEQFYYNHWMKCKPMSYCSLLVCLSYVIPCVSISCSLF